MRTFLKPQHRSLLLILSVIVAAAVAVNSLQTNGGPNPIYDPRAWSEWIDKAPVSAFMSLIATAMAALGAWAAISGLFKPQSATKADVDEMRTAIEGMHRQLVAMAAQQGRHLDGVATTHVDQALEAVANSDSAALANARTALKDGDPAGVVDALMASAEASAAERYRQAGAIAYAFDTGRSLEAYSKAGELDPADIWTQIQLARLLQTAGTLKEARAHAEQALTSASTSRERAIALDVLGDIERAEGNPASSFASFEQSLQISLDGANGLTADAGQLAEPRSRDALISAAKAARSYKRSVESNLAAADVRGREKEDLSMSQSTFIVDLLTDPAIKRISASGDVAPLRDLGVSYEKMGDLALAAKDVFSAKKMYAGSLAIATELVRRDQSDEILLRDLSVRENKAGDVSLSLRNFDDARRHYESGLAIRTDLAARDASNLRRQRDLSFSQERLGDLSAALGDYGEASTQYEKAREIRSAIVEKDPSSNSALYDLAATFQRLGDVCSAQNNMPLAKSHWSRAAEIMSRLRSADPANSIWSNAQLTLADRLKLLED